MCIHHKGETKNDMASFQLLFAQRNMEVNRTEAFLIVTFHISQFSTYLFPTLTAHIKMAVHKMCANPFIPLIIPKHDTWQVQGCRTEQTQTALFPSHFPVWVSVELSHKHTPNTHPALLVGSLSKQNGAMSSMKKNNAIKTQICLIFQVTNTSQHHWLIHWLIQIFRQFDTIMSLVQNNSDISDTQLGLRKRGQTYTSL